MKNQIISLLLTTAIFAVTPAFAKEVGDEEQLVIRLKKLADRRDKEIARQNKLVRKSPASHQTNPSESIFSFWDFLENIKSSLKGVSNDHESIALMHSHNKVRQIHGEMIKVKEKLGPQKTGTVVLTSLDILISRAKEEDIQAQNELIKRQYQGVGSILTPDTINFCSWANLHNRCYENDDYARFALKNNIKIPQLFEMIKQKAEQNDLVAQYHLGWMYVKGLGDGGQSDENNKLAFEWLTKAAKQDYTRSQYFLGWMYLNELGLPKNDTKAIKWFRRAARKRDADSQYILGWMYRYGQGIGKNNDKASRYFKMAAQQGLPDAQYELGRMYAKGRMNGGQSDENNKRAVEWLNKAAEQGHMEAQYELGLMYAMGLGTPKNDTESFRWLKKAAKQGLPDAQYKLGVMHVLAYKNHAEAIKWYKKAAEQGHTDAQYILGHKYALGLGVEKDLTETLSWWLKSKKADAKESIYSLLTPDNFVYPENKSKSLKDMLNEILQEDKGLSIDPNDNDIGLSSLFNRTFFKIEMTNPDYIPELNEHYERIEKILGDLLGLIGCLKENSTPGLMLTAFSPSTELKDSIAHQQPSPFLSIDTINNQLYFTIGEKNVLLVGKLVKYLKTIDEEFKKADDQLKAIANGYRQTQKQKEAEQIENERVSLNKVKCKIKTIIPDGANGRNEEFFKENSFLDVQDHLNRLNAKIENERKIREQQESKRSNNYSSKEAATARREGKMWGGGRA